MSSFFRNKSWVTFPFFTLTTLASIVGLAIYIPLYGVHPLEPVVCVAFVYLVAWVVSSGYHRCFAHKSFRCHPALKIFYLIVGSAAFQQSALKWVSDHRYHHQYVDTDKDPYNIQKGFWWAHMGWILEKAPEGSREKILANTPDLRRDKWIVWQDRYWPLIGALISIIIPVAIGFMIHRPFGMFLWAGLTRVVLSLQSTFLINSLAHKFGTQPYTDKHSAHDVWWIAPLFCGENYHNYHHAFQGDYRNGVRWYQWDPSKWSLWLLAHTPLVKDLRRTPQHVILKTRLEMDLKRLEEKTRPFAEESKARLLEYLQGMRQRLEEAALLYHQTRKNYRELKKNMVAYSRASLVDAKKSLRERRAIFKNTMRDWQRVVRMRSEVFRFFAQGQSGMSPTS